MACPKARFVPKIVPDSPGCDIICSMTTTIRCHFDGKVLIPDEPVDLPVDKPLTIRVEGARGGVVLVPPKKGKGMTGAKLAASKFVGMWADRTDITDSTEFVRELRRRSEQRGGGE